MSKKVLSLVLAFCMITTLGLTAITASAEIPESPWPTPDPDAVVAGTDTAWSVGRAVAAEAVGETKGFIAPTSSGNKTTSDPAFTNGAASVATPKRNWGKFISTNAITSTDSESYAIEFIHSMNQGSYAVGHIGLYVYLRSATFNNYLDNRFAITLRRNINGVPQIGLKPANTSHSVDTDWLDIDPSVSLLGSRIRIVDNFAKNLIKVYGTDAEGTYKLIGVYFIDPETSSVTLLSGNGYTLTATGYSNAISTTSTTPGFLLNEYSGIMSDLTVSYPAEEKFTAVTATPGSGSYLYDELELTLSTADEDAVIYYTIDGTDPIENEDERFAYMDGDLIDLNPDGLDYPLDVTLKVVEEIDGEYSPVQTFEYTLTPVEGSFGVNYDNVAAGTDANWKPVRAVTATKMTDDATYNNAYTVAKSGWSHIATLNPIYAAAQSASLKFNVKDVLALADHEDGKALYISFKNSAEASMMSNTTPFIAFDANTVGFRDATPWTSAYGIVERVPFGVDIDLADGEIHEIELRDYFGGNTLFFIDGILVAEAVIANGTLTLTNAAGQQISRTGVVAADNAFKYNVVSLHNTAVIGEIATVYPTEEVVYPKAVIDAEDGQLFASFDSFDITAETDSGVMYYTLDGTVPTLESETTDGTITIPTTSEGGEIVAYVRPYLDGTWGIGDKVTYTVLDSAETFKQIFKTVEPASDYVKVIEIDTSVSDSIEVYYTLDGTEPSAESGIKAVDGKYIIATENTTLKAIYYAGESYVSDVYTQNITVGEKGFTQLVFDPQAALDDADENWTQASNNKNSVPTYYVNDDGSVKFEGTSSIGGVGAIMTINDLTAADHGVVVTEFDVHGWQTDKDHKTAWLAIRSTGHTATTLTDKTRFFIKLSGSQIGIKHATWGGTDTLYAETGAPFNASGTEFQHLTIVDDKINNVIRVFGNDYLLGTFTFYTTTNENDTVLLTVPSGVTQKYQFPASVPTDGQVYLAQAYSTAFTVKNLVVHYGNGTPYRTVEFNAGELGTVENATVKVPFDSAIGTVPEVSIDAIFAGWTNDGGKTILSSEEVAEIVPDFNMTFDAIYVTNLNEALNNAISVVPTNSQYYSIIKIDKSSLGVLDLYYTLDDTEPSKDNGILAKNGEHIVFTKNGSFRAVAYDLEGNPSEVANYSCSFDEKIYKEYVFDAQATLDGTDPNWTHGSNNKNDVPTYYVNEDGSIRFEGTSSIGGVGSIMTIGDLTAEEHGVVITEFDARGWRVDKHHQTGWLGLRSTGNHKTSMTEATRFFIKLSGSQIGIKNAGWGGTDTLYVESGAPFDASGTEFQHIIVIDDKINNEIRVFSNEYLLGTFTFSTTTNENDTVTLTTPAGNTVSRTFSASVPTDGQVYIGQAYCTDFMIKDLVVYSGNTAGEEVNVTLEDATAECGRTALVPFSVTSEVPVIGYVNVAYDNTVLTFNPEASSELVTDNGDGTLTISVENSAEGVLAFDFVQGVPGATANIQVADYELVAADGTLVEIITLDATITVDVLMGDVNSNGKIDVYDAIAVLKHVAGIESLEGNGLTAANVEQDDVITVTDATKILKYVARLINEL